MLSEGGSSIIQAQVKSAKRRKYKAADSISLYAALSRMDGYKNIQHTQGYEMLRQLSYATQQELADGNVVRLAEIFE